MDEFPPEPGLGPRIEEAVSAKNAPGVPATALAPHFRLVEIDRLLTEDGGRFAPANLP